MFFCVIYVPYLTLLPRQAICSTNYVLATDDIQCGSANSFAYSAIRIEGNQQKGDHIKGLIEAWLTKKNNLTLYSRLHPSIVIPANSKTRQQILLVGWQIYTWTGSVIYGYFCITNNDVIEKTAYLYIFTSDADAESFINDNKTTNPVLFDSITIPPEKDLQCFEKWGPGKPFEVSRSSYHYIGVDIPGNSNFTYNVTVLQMFVNGSDYSDTHFFNYANSTTLSIASTPNNLFIDEDYIAICKAPMCMSLKPFETQSVRTPTTTASDLISSYGAVSLHLTSCNEPYHWRKIVFPALLGVGVPMLILTSGLFLITCCCMRKFQDRLFISCHSCNKPTRESYSRIQ